MHRASLLTQHFFLYRLYFVLPEPGTTLQSIGEQQWQVGKRYKLQKVLGYGSNSTVCLALDTCTQEHVALKRIGNVLQSPLDAKHVLREIAILRRLSHPNIISLHDCFVRPSATGECRLKNGKLVMLSLDLYIAMEWADGGDLFHLKGQLTEAQVKRLMAQILNSLNYLHSLNIWHRDVKSSNFLIKWQNGERILKLADFGSSRFVGDGDGNMQFHSKSDKRTPSCLVPPHKVSSFADDIEMEDRGVDADDEKDLVDMHQYKAPLTALVTTPCYRSPEVILSRGGYSSEIDVWSIGCIFGEVLQRIAFVGSAATPHLQVAPLFAIRGKPLTPLAGEVFDHPGNSSTRRELAALFNVIGTPSWSDIEAIESPQWRHYLEHLPGKAPTLFRRFGAAGEPAVDLLRRMLEFDPSRRCSCEEALHHEYFGNMIKVEEEGSPQSLCENSGGNLERTYSSKEPMPGRALAMLEAELSTIQTQPGTPTNVVSEEAQRLRHLLESECAAVEGGGSACLQIKKGGKAVHTIVDTGQVHTLSSLLGSHRPGLQLDTGLLDVDKDLGGQRLSNVAETQQGALEPGKFLGTRRHGEWTAFGDKKTTGSGSQSWGVSVLPPGSEKCGTDAKLLAAIQRQQAR